jgi:hypothetical protein
MNVLGMIALRYYPIKRDYLDQLKDFIETSHRDKKEEYLEKTKHSAELL